MGLYLADVHGCCEAISVAAPAACLPLQQLEMRQERVGWVSAREQAVTNMRQETETPDTPEMLKRQPQTSWATKERKPHRAARHTLRVPEWYRSKAGCVFHVFTHLSLQPCCSLRKSSLLSHRRPELDL